MRNQTTDGIVIAGGGLAGQRCAETLRRSGYDGPIRMLCAEIHRPYDRPPLSKELLTGEHPVEELPFRPADWYEHKQVDLLLGVARPGSRPRSVGLRCRTAPAFATTSC